jgi:hypothetical protein
LFGALPAEAQTIINTPAVPGSVIDPCANPYQPKSNIAINITTAGTAQLLALSGTTIIYVCGYNFVMPNTATTATSVKFIGGTGSNCGTPVTTLTGVMTSNDAAAVSANPTVVTVAPGASTLFATAAGSELCTVVTGNGTLAIGGHLTYVQQ